MIFGQTPIAPKVLAEKVIDAVRSLRVRGDRAWFKAVQGVCCSCMPNGSALVCTRLREKGLHEWLLDLVWWDKNTGNVSLGLECEWGREQFVMDDFSKLLSTKAPLKVMVYFCRKDSFVHHFERQLEKFTQHVKDEQYLLIEFHQDENDRAYLYNVPSNGKLVSGAKFAELRLSESVAA